MSDFAYYSKNGEILDVNQASISLYNIEYTYGFGVYESLRIRKGIPYFAVDHINRLFSSAQLIHIEHQFTKEQVTTYVQQLIEKFTQEAYNIKILLIGGKKSEDAELHILPMAPKFPDRKLYKTGASVISTYLERIFPQAKSLNMLPSYLAYREATLQGAYDALLLDREDRILEGTRTNFFAIKDRILYTPRDSEVLHGVARRNVIHIARENEFDVVEKDIFIHEIDTYDGAILTSTSAKVMPIISIDDVSFDSISEHVKELVKLYNQFLQDSKGVFNE